MRSPRGAWFRLPGDDERERAAKRGRVEGIHFTNIRVQQSPPSSVRQLLGYDEAHAVQDVTLQGLWIGGKQILSAEEGGFFVQFAKGVRFLPAEPREQTRPE